MKRNGENFFKRSLTRKVLCWLPILVITIGTLLVLAGSILSFVAQKKAAAEFQKVNGTFSSLKINLFARSVTVKDLAWESPIDSFPHSAKIGRIHLSGVRLFQLLFKKELYAQELLIDSGAIQYNQSQKKDTLKAGGSNAYSFEIENVILRNIFLESKRDSTTEMEGMLNLHYGALKVESTHTITESCQTVFRYFKGDITKLKVSRPGGFYTTHVDKIEFNSQDQSISLDSVKVIPNYAKYEFGKVSRSQVSRLKLDIKRIAVIGLNYPKLFDSLFSIHKISVQHANLHSFRDRRIPFTKTENIAMPMMSLKALSFALEIDSITVEDATITAEEFAPLAIQPGYINFQKLSALMVGLSNRYYTNKPQYTQLDASAMIMGNGLITASFRFPLDGSPLYSAKGKISNLSLLQLNSILENSAQVRIKSGLLNELFFNFNYTDFNSTGTVEINYENLRLVKLNSDKGKSTDHLKTALINAFLKKTKNESTEQRKRIGTIDTDRDRQRTIINLWWKSLQSGLRSSVLGNEKK